MRCSIEVHQQQSLQAEEVSEVVSESGGHREVVNTPHVQGNMPDSDYLVANDEETLQDSEDAFYASGDITEETFFAANEYKFWRFGDNHEEIEDEPFLDSVSSEVTHTKSAGVEYPVFQTKSFADGSASQADNSAGVLNSNKVNTAEFLHVHMEL